jgi:hypothetical protein
MLCATKGVPRISYDELTAANVAEVRLRKELLEEAQLGEEVARRLLADLAYRGEDLAEELAGSGIALVTPARPAGGEEGSDSKYRDRLFELEGSLWSRRDVGDDHHRAGEQDLKAKMTAYTNAFYINRLLGRPQGTIKELWA